MKRYTVPGILTVILLCTVLFTACSQNTLQGNVESFFHLYTQPASGRIHIISREFSDKHSGVTLNTRTLPYQDMKKALLNYLDGVQKDDRESYGVTAVLTGGDLANNTIRPLVQTASPWIRKGWKLYYSPARLAKSGWTREALEELSEKGIDDFISQMKDICLEGESVFLLGADFYWPWLSWIQHLYAVENNGRMPRGYDIDQWSEAISTWETLIAEEGVFNADYKKTNLAGSLLGITQEKGLFVLSDSNIYSVYPPDERGSIESISFPGSGTWEIGTVFYLAVLGWEGSSPGVAAARAYRAYLHSEAVRNRMLSSAGTYILPISNETGAQVKREIPSITQDVRDPDIQELLKYLDR